MSPQTSNHFPEEAKKKRGKLRKGEERSERTKRED